ncbi:hypothetical protein HN682_01075, partial [Candidatus Peregrinibacteria bacterium]|nr:hypothetical protein [Candidatus Peregrinibacteria bacterium]
MNKKLTKKLERAEIEVARIDKELARLKRYVKEQGFSLRLVPDDHVTRREYSERQKEYVNRNMPIGYSCCSDEVFRIKTLVEEERPGHRRVIVFLKGLQNFSDELPKVVRDKDPFFPGDKGINFRSLKGYSLWVPNYSRNVCHPRSGVVEPLRPNSLVYRFRG